jgi:hypothetical protein
VLFVLFRGRFSLAASQPSMHISPTADSSGVRPQARHVSGQTWSNAASGLTLRDRTEAVGEATQSLREKDRDRDASRDIAQIDYEMMFKRWVDQ